MTIQTINVGGYANDSTGDDLRTAFNKVNANFALLGGTVGVQSGINLGPTTGNVGNVFAQRNNTTTNLEFKTLTSTDNSVEITSTSSTVNLKNKSVLINDPLPTVTLPVFNGAILTNPFNLNSNIVVGGDVQTSIFGIDVRTLGSLVELMISSNTTDLNFGSIDPASSTTYNIDFNGVNPDSEGFDNDNPVGITVDFGAIVQD
jgi:hypothetical protein